MALQTVSGNAVFSIALGVIVVLIAVITLLSSRESRWPGRNWHVLGQAAPLNVSCPGENVCNLFFDHIVFFDELHGLAIAHTNQPYDARLYRTRNGGVHWNEERIFGSGPVADITAYPNGTVALLHGWRNVALARDARGRIKWRLAVWPLIIERRENGTRHRAAAGATPSDALKAAAAAVAGRAGQAHASINEQRRQWHAATGLSPSAGIGC